MIVRAFITHKQAETFSDCQDRFGVNTDTKSISVSDGVSMSWHQKIWAQLLVNTFIDSTTWLPTHENIKSLCNQWREKVKKIIQNLKDKNAPEHLIYRNERYLAENKSAGATFVGIRFTNMEWSGMVLGDSCLIEWDGAKATFYTSQQEDSFDNSPDYFDSDPQKSGKGTPKKINGTINKKSVLLLVSDPFSDYLLKHNKQGDVAKYINLLLEIDCHDKFEAIVEEWRKDGMHNDDSTLVVIEYDNNEDVEIQKMDDINDLIDKEQADEKSTKGLKEEDNPSPETNQASKTEENTTSATLTTNICYVDENQFIKEFFDTYYHIIFEKNRPNNKKILKKWFNRLKYDAIEKAAEDALVSLFKKYSIIKK